MAKRIKKHLKVAFGLCEVCGHHGEDCKGIDKREAYESFKTAVLALTQCWDALNELETDLGCDVECEDIQATAGDDDTSEQAFLDFLREIKAKRAA